MWCFINNMSWERGRLTVGLDPAEEVPSSWGKMSSEMLRGESLGKGPETTQLRLKNDLKTVTFPEIWWNGDTSSEQAHTAGMNALDRRVGCISRMPPETEGGLLLSHDKLSSLQLLMTWHINPYENRIPYQGCRFWHGWHIHEHTGRLPST